MDRVPSLQRLDQQAKSVVDPPAIRGVSSDLDILLKRLEDVRIRLADSTIHLKEQFGIQDPPLPARPEEAVYEGDTLPGKIRQLTRTINFIESIAADLHRVA